MILRTQGIVLRVLQFSRTSQIAVWLTREYGKLTTIVKGAARPKSSFLGQYDLFYSCEVLFYARERNGSHVMRECSPTSTRPVLRDKWRAAAAASYFCELASKLTEAGESGPVLYSLLDYSLDFLCANPVDRSSILWFEIQATGSVGFAPRLSSCVKCGGTPASSDGLFSFSPSGGGVVCDKCTEQYRSDLTTISSDARDAMLRWQAAGVPHAAIMGRRSTSERLIGETDPLMRRFMEFHVPVPLVGRGIVMELMR
jgi:DNA repair protein RecO (recombination protein O)